MIKVNLIIGTTLIVFKATDSTDALNKIILYCNAIHRYDVTDKELSFLNDYLHYYNILYELLPKSEIRLKPDEAIQITIERVYKKMIDKITQSTHSEPEIYIVEDELC